MLTNFFKADKVNILQSCSYLIWFVSQKYLRCKCWTEVKYVLINYIWNQGSEVLYKVTSESSLFAKDSVMSISVSDAYSSVVTLTCKVIFCSRKLLERYHNKIAVILL